MEINELRSLIRNIIISESHVLSEDYRFEYDQQHTPTDAMSIAAKKAKQISDKTNLIAAYKAQGGVVTGEKKSQKIISKTPMNHNEVRALRDLFTSLTAEVAKEKGQGKTINNSAIIQIWDLNGGDAGKGWANNILGGKHDSSMKHKELRRGYGDVGIVKNMMKARMPKKKNPK